MRKNIFGVTLFSVIQKKSKKYIIHTKEHENYLAELFSEDRLNLKSDIFFNLSLPQLDQMDKSECNYKHLIIYSHELPEAYKNLIADANKKFSFIHAIAVSDYSDFNIRDEVKKYVQPGEVFALFGLDDDDLLSIDYLQKLKRYLKREFIGFNISMSKGFSGYYDGKLHYCREVRFPFINIGQARICERKTDGNIVIPDKGSHMRTDEKCPTIIDSRHPNFFWFRHSVQDTFSDSKSEAAFLKIKSDLDNYPEPSESIENRFPVLSNIISKKESAPLSSAKNINLKNYKKEEKIFRNLTPLYITGNISIKYELSNHSGSSRRQAIAIFKLTRVLSEAETVNSGLQVSKVGYYRYFNTSSEGGSFSISLPSDVYISDIDAMKWGEETIFLHSIQILK